MRVSVSSKGYTLSGVNPNELNVVMSLLGTLKDRCFLEREDNGEYYDGGDFVASLDEDKLSAFHSFVDKFWHELNAAEARINSMKQ
jgi:hypothetical protein